MRAELTVLQTLNEVEELGQVANEDNHLVIYPTHIARKNGEIVGYCSFATPCVYIWSSTKRVTPRDSLALWRQVEDVAVKRGIRAITMPCAPESPYKQYMSRQGYDRLGATEIYIKHMEAA